MAGFNLLPARGRRLFEDLISDANLVALWTLNEQATPVYDRSANRMNGTANGSPVYGVTVGPAVGVTLDGSAAYYSLGVQAPLAFERTSPFSALALVNPNVSQYGALLSKWAANRGWLWSIDGARQPRLGLGNNVANDMEIQDQSPLTNGTVYLLGTTYDGSSTPGGVKFYQNGVVSANNTITNNLSATILTTAEAQIGAIGGGNLYNGSLAMLAVFNAVKAAQDMNRWAYLAGVL